MDLPVTPPLPPMEAEPAEELPPVDAAPEGWLYEPKWDGFRCLAFRDGGEVYLQSKAGKPLGRYFPDVVEDLGRLGARRFVLDGELVIGAEGQLSFDELQLRLHPAESRVAKLAAENPASFLVFDLLVTERSTDLTGEPLAVRRGRLETFGERYFPKAERVHVSPADLDRGRARRWLDEGGVSLDGVLAKRLGAPYRSGERDAMVKVKRLHTVDCVVAGFRYGTNDDQVGSMLLGLYDDEGLLHHVGYTSSFSGVERAELTRRLEELVGGDGDGFTGRAPGGPSRWSTERSGRYESLRPEMVAEVTYDHWSGGRFRHGTRFVRFRPDKLPEQCTLDQVPHARPRGPSPLERWLPGLLRSTPLA